MSASSERRERRRIIVGADHTVRFLVHGHPFKMVRLTNLSLSGAFLTLGPRDANLFLHETFLEQFAFEHPSLEGPPFTARVTFVLGGVGSGPREHLGVGLQFIGLPIETEARLEALIQRSLG